MDTLSQVLQSVRARSPLLADLRVGTDVSLGLPALGGLPFHYVVTGTCCLDTGSERVDLRAGDFVMLARLPFYRLETGSATRRIEVMDFAERDNFRLEDLRTGRDRLLRTMAGDEPLRARIFSAILIPAGPDTRPLTRDLPVVTLLRDVKTLLDPWLITAIEAVSADVRDPEPGLSAVTERLIEVIFLAVLRRWLLDGDHAHGWMRGLADPVISRVLDVIHAKPGRRWTLHDLALASGCSRSGLAKRFHEVMGETPFAYLTRWRMHLAAAALATERRSVADVGASFGYKNSQAFTRAFLAAFGETPAQYRRQPGAIADRRDANPR